MADADESVAALKSRGLELAQGNRLEEARACYARVVERSPDDAEAWCVLSSIHGHLGRLDEAETCCRRAIALRDDYDDAHMNLGNVLSAQGRFEEALAHYETVLARHPRHPLVLCNVGYVQSALGKYDEAAARYRAAIEVNPQLADAHYNLGNLQDLQGHPAQAEAAYRAALAVNPGHAGARHNLGLVLAKQGRAPEAEEAYREALRLAPGFAKAHHSLGRLLHGLGRLDEAETAYREALRLTPDYDDAENDLGNVLLEQDRAEEAARCYQAVLSRRPSAFSHCNLGNLRQRQGRLDEAIDHYRRALALDPGRAEVHSNLGNALRQQGRFAQAQVALREAVRLDPGYAEAYVNLGKALTEGGGPGEEALTSYRRARELRPDYALAAAGEAAILEKRGEFERAYACLAPFVEAGKPDVAVTLVFASLCRALDRRGEAVALLERVLGDGTATLEAADRIPLNFALGRLLDAAGEYERAFACYREANELSGGDFDIQAHTRRDTAIMASFSKEFLARAPRATVHSQRPVFIVGMPRSGTSLVEQILASHPAVFGAGELEEIHRIVAGLDGGGTPYPGCVQSLTPADCTRLARRYLDYLEGLAPPQAEWVTDKMPSNLVHLGLINLLFPEARVIHCMRDPLDTCLSCYFQDFDERLPYTCDLGHLGAYYIECERLMAHWRTVLDLPLMEVRYEDLVADQEGVSRALVEFCGLEWDERCLRFYETRRVVATASYDQVRQPLYSRSVGRWRHYERHLAPLRRALGDYGPPPAGPDGARG